MPNSNSVPICTPLDPLSDTSPVPPSTPDSVLVVVLAVVVAVVVVVVVKGADRGVGKDDL